MFPQTSVPSGLDAGRSVTSSGTSSMFGYVNAQASAWRRSHAHESKKYGEFLRQMQSSRDASQSHNHSGVPSSVGSPNPPTSPIRRASVSGDAADSDADDAVDSALWAASDQLYRRHMQRERVPIKWITSVERAWNKAGAHLKSGKTQGEANAKVGGFVPGYAGQAVWETTSSSGHSPRSFAGKAPTPPPPASELLASISDAVDRPRPRTTHRKLKTSLGFSDAAASPRRLPTAAAAGDTSPRRAMSAAAGRTSPIRRASSVAASHAGITVRTHGIAAGPRRPAPPSSARSVVSAARSTHAVLRRVPYSSEAPLPRDTHSGVVTTPVNSGSPSRRLTAASLLGLQ